MNLYFGDIHNHCGISYGFGGLENALNAAKNHLDFCNVTGHALWPDIHKRKPEVEYTVDFHKEGFKKLADQWEDVTNLINQYNTNNEFVTFQGYEMHSRKYGDHHILTDRDYIPIVDDISSPYELIEKLKPKSAIAVPHHIAYTPGYRGINWEYFNEEISPVVEVFSKHGCGISDTAQYNYLHTMGPRDSKNTVMSGLKSGNKFGFTASTDHHAGYPGSYGDGRVAVYAKAKTRKAIWEAIKSRRTYAVTGDKIRCMFKVNDNIMGSVIPAENKRNIYANIKGSDFLDRITLYKNAQPLKMWNFAVKNSDEKSLKTAKYKIRIEMGWGKNTEPFTWNGKIKVDGGTLLDYEPCFRGRSILAPSKDMNVNKNVNALNNKVLSASDKQIDFCCQTFKNVSNLHSQTCSVILKVEGNEKTRITTEINGIKKTFMLKDLLAGSTTFHMSYYNTQAVLMHRAVPEKAYSFECEYIDNEKLTDSDFYHMTVRQNNGQMAWITPVFMK